MSGATLTARIPTAPRNPGIDFVFIVGIFIASRFLIAITMVVWGAITQDGQGPLSLIDYWDSGWYGSIVNHGYDLAGSGGNSQGQHNWAFFPLFPLLSLLIGSMTGLSWPLSGTLLSNLCILFAAWVCFSYVSQSRSREAAWSVVVLLFAGPYSLYFAIAYSEALFVFLIVAGIAAWENKKYFLAALCSVGLGACRPTGLLFVLYPLTGIIVEAARAGPFIGSLFALIRDKPLRLLPLFTPLIGIAGFMIFLAQRTGDPLAFLHAQLSWDHNAAFPLVNLFAAFFDEPKYLYYAFWGLAGLVMAVWLVARKRFAESVLLFALTLFPMASGLISLPRYISGTAVWSFGLGELTTLSKKWLRFVLLTLAVLSGVACWICWFARFPFMI